MTKPLKKNKKSLRFTAIRGLSVKKIIIQKPSISFNFYQSFAGINFT
jgi:hypothetical protein